MSNSSLVSYTHISPNSNNPRNDTIRKITIHHMAGNATLRALGNQFANPARQASANYAIDSEGYVGQYVYEENRAWTSSSASNDNQAITIEVANDGGAPDWHVSDKAINSLIDLCVDICKRNNISSLNFTGDASGNLTMHCYFTATECPGPYLKSKFSYIASQVNSKLSQSTSDSYDGGTFVCYKVDGVNTGRGENQLIQYIDRPSTGTNSYGFEVAVDRNAIILGTPKWVGNSKIPEGGYVLSGHGEAGKWLYANARQGYLSAIYDGVLKIQKSVSRTFDGINTGRGTDQLILYTDAVKTTGTNMYGFEVCIVDGVATSDPIYGNGNIGVAPGTYVLSGHGEAGSWLYCNVKKGTKVDISTQWGYINVL